MKLISLIALFAMLASICKAAPKADEIVHLPELSEPINFKHYSGFLDGALGDKLHYWFVTSQSNPEKDPVVLWLNGGPGCSSLDGLLNELGPYHIADNGTLYMNEYSWNRVANIIFLESPKCVGFSHNPTNSDCASNDDSVSKTNFYALQSFFKKFPEFSSNYFYVIGESYGGIYVPTLVERILKESNTVPPINLQAFAIGNGLSSYALNDDSLMFFGYYHGLIGTELWSSLLKSCCKRGIPGRHTCNFSRNNSPACQILVEKTSNLIYNDGLNMYNVYAKCLYPIGDSLNATSRYHFDRQNLFVRNSNKVQRLGLSSRQGLTLDPPCTDSTAMRKYLNRADVKKALHIPDGLPAWDICSVLDYTNVYEDMRAQYRFILQSTPGLIYNGDVDMACNFLGEEWFFDDLGLEVIKDRHMWHIGDQVAGFWKSYKNLNLVTIRGAGHMVPQDKPAAAYKLFKQMILPRHSRN